VLRDIELFLFAPIVVVLLVGLMLWFFFLRRRRFQGSQRRVRALREEVEGTPGKRIYPPIHPGELLQEEFLEPMEILPDELAKGTGVPVQHIRELVREKGKITPDLSTRLGRYFGMSEGFWMRVQARYDQEVEQDRRERKAG
jgi:addiction module HigA family antidote